jgi:hypothetical protein
VNTKSQQPGLLDLATLLAVGLPLAAFGILILGLTGFQAWRRGYNPVVWTLAGVFAQNPLFVLVVLAMCPFRRRVRLREQFERELDEKLAARGDDRPTAAADGPVRDRSIGDVATQFPQRSIGDDQTTM